MDAPASYNTIVSVSCFVKLIDFIILLTFISKLILPNTNFERRKKHFVMSMNSHLICVIDEQEVVLEYFIVRISDDIEELRQVEEHARVCHNLLGVKEIQEVQEVQ